MAEPGGPAPSKAEPERPLGEVLLDVLDDDEHRRTRIAWLYYVEGRTQAEIAELIGVSRVKVVRDLAVCRESGLVQIRINGRLAPCVRLERELLSRFGLREALVVPTPTDVADLPTALGMATGAFLSDRVAPGQTIGVGWGRTLHWSVRAVRRRAVADLEIVSLLGGVGRGSEINPYETASRLAEVLSAQCYYLAGPTFATTPELRDLLLTQPGLREIYERALVANLTLVSVGSLDPSTTIRRLGLVTAEESADLAELGAVGDLLGHHLDAAGAIVPHPLNDRVIGLPPERLRQVPVSILASGGPDKHRIIRAALVAGYVNTVITDERTAVAVLAT